MKPLSQSLTDSAARVKRLEDSAVAVQDRNQAALRKRREELDAAIDREVQEFDTATAEAKEAARGWWSDTGGSIERQITVMRAELARGEADRLAARS